MECRYCAPSSLQRGISVLYTERRVDDWLRHATALIRGTHWDHVCLVPFRVAVAKKNEYWEEDIDSELEYL